MPEANDQGKETAADDKSAGITAEEVKRIVAEAFGESMKTVNEQIAAIAGNQKVLADTLAKLPPAGAKDDGAGAADEPKYLTAEDAETLFVSALQKHADAQTASAADRDARAAFVQSDASGLARLAPLASAMGFDVASKLGSDKAMWGNEAKAIAAGFEKFVKDHQITLPDIGGGARDGGNAPGGGGNAAENAAKPGSWIKMPAA